MISINGVESLKALSEVLARSISGGSVLFSFYFTKVLKLAMLLPIQKVYQIRNIYTINRALFLLSYYRK